MAYLLDADWAIEALIGRGSAARTLALLAGRRLAICWVTIGEIYERAFHSPNPEAHLTSFRQFLSPYHVLGLDDAIVERFAELRAYLRRRGEPISDFDIIVGATALHHNLTVLTFNQRHLGRIPELKLYQPVR